MSKLCAKTSNASKDDMLDVYSETWEPVLSALTRTGFIAVSNHGMVLYSEANRPLFGKFHITNHFRKFLEYVHDWDNLAQ